MGTRTNVVGRSSSTRVKPSRTARTSPRWHMFTALVLVAVLVILVVTETSRWPWYLPGFLLLVTAYVWVATRSNPTQGERVMILATVMVGFTLVAIGTPFAMLLTLVLIAQFFWFLPPFAATVLAGTVGVISAWALFYHTVPNATTASLILVIAALMGVTVGVWLSQIFTLTARQEAMIEQLRESRAEVARQSALKGASEERNRVSQEIHDGLAQQISATLMLLRSAESQISNGNSTKALERLALARQHSEMSIAESRFLLGQSRLDVGEQSIAETISELVEMFEKTSGIASTFACRGDWASTALASELIRALLRIVSEALSNCLRHSGASKVSVQLVKTTRTVELTVADNGVGFDAEQSPLEHARGWGLEGIPRRVEDLDGTFDLQSEPGRGTRMSVSLPLTEEPAEG